MTMEMTDPTSNAFVTPDYWLSGALVASGKRLLRLTWRGGRAFFVFAEGAECADAADRYWAGDLQVGARAFADGLRLLKDRLHARPYGDDNGYPPNHTR